MWVGASAVVAMMVDIVAVVAAAVVVVAVVTAVALIEPAFRRFSAQSHCFD